MNGVKKFYLNVHFIIEYSVALVAVLLMHLPMDIVYTVSFCPGWQHPAYILANCDVKTVLLVKFIEE